MIMTEAGASVTFCWNFDAPYTTSTLTFINSSRLSWLRSFWGGWAAAVPCPRASRGGRPSASSKRKIAAYLVHVRRAVLVPGVPEKLFRGAALTGSKRVNLSPWPACLQRISSPTFIAHGYNRVAKGRTRGSDENVRGSESRQPEGESKKRSTH